MNAAVYADMVDTRATNPPKLRLSWKWWAIAVLVGAASSILWSELYGTGSIVLVAAAWAAVLVLAIVSCTRFSRRQRRDQAAKVSSLS